MVDSIRLFDLASQQARWLSLKETSVAENVANANTPGYKTKDVKPFQEVLHSAVNPVTMQVTNARHIVDDSVSAIEQSYVHKESFDMNYSGNDVVLEAEMRKGSEVARNMSMNTAVVKAFHNMFLSVLK